MSSLATEKEARNRLLLLMLALGGGYFLSRHIETIQLPIFAGALLFLAALGFSFIRGTQALYVVIFAMLFSPEIGAGGMQATRASGEGGGIVIRVEDVILVAVGIGWILRSAYLRKSFGIMKSPVSGAIGYYIAISTICTLLGAIDGKVKLDVAFFHNLKYFEYFFLFFMILAHIRRVEDIRGMITAMLVVLFLVSIYGYSQMAQGIRVSAPFDAEPNTFGGYLALMACVAGGILLTDRRPLVSILFSLLLLFVFPPFLFTLSRSSYTALLAGLIAFMLISRQRMVILAVSVVAVLVILAGIFVVPEKVQERVTGTFRKGTQYHVQIAGVDLDPSASARVVSYEQAVNAWLEKPLFGHGVKGTLFVDGQYFRLLAETGVFGLFAFLFMMAQLLRSVWFAYKNAREPYLKGASMGFFCGVVAMMVHALTANSFIIIRIAEPLWLLAGLVLLIPHLEEPEPESAVNVPAGTL